MYRAKPVQQKSQKSSFYILKIVFSFVMSAFVSQHLLLEFHREHKKFLKVSIRAKSLMQKLNNGRILFIFIKKLLQKYQAFGHTVKRPSSG